MRFAALCLALVACSSDPSPAAVTDAAPSDVVLDVAPDVAVPDAPADVAPDVAADVAPVDATAPDVAVADAVRDAGADVVDAPPADRGCTPIGGTICCGATECPSLPGAVFSCDADAGGLGLTDGLLDRARAR